MKVGIEGQRLYRKKKHGMDMVALELIKNLQHIDHQNEYVVFVKPDEDHRCIPVARNFKVVELSGGPYPLWEQVALPRAARAEGCDILHCTSNTGPIWTDIPLITILHDIIYLESISLFKRGGTWYQKVGNMYRRWVVPPVVKKSKRVSTVSNFERERISSFMGINDRLVTVYNGVGSHFGKITDAKVLTDAKNKFRLPDDFLFFLGNTDPKKNTPNVLKAFAELNKDRKDKFWLVMLDYDENELRAILNEIGHPKMREWIHLTGYVNNLELPSIINQCKVFLYPSLRESFGIPILEGMACGVPVITSNTSSMPEIAGDAAHIVDPRDSDQITEGITKILTDEIYRNELIQKGQERAKMFSWANMAEQYLKLYQEVYAEINSNK